MDNTNASFGLPPEVTPPAVETEQERIARLRAKAEAQAAQEFDEDAVYAKLLADARAAKLAKLENDKGVEFPTDTRGFLADYDKIVVFRGQDKNALGYVPLGINGFVIKVPRDEEVIIPHEFTEVLEHAIEEITIVSQGGLVTRPAHRYPFNFKGKATPAEYQAFQVAQKNKAERQIAQAT